MKAAEVDYTLKNYEGATHGFTNPDATEKGKEFELPLAYDEATDEASWAELEALLRSACAG